MTIDPLLRDQVRFTGYLPGVIGRIVELHATYYYEYWGFDVSFEVQVGRELSEFIGSFQEGRDGFWVATYEGEPIGAIAVDGKRAHTEGARIRWYIVAPDFQGYGIGRTLLCDALTFCKSSSYKKVYLWTFRGLNRARRLYERAGFRLCEEHEVDQWGRNIREQKFELILP